MNLLFCRIQNLHISQTVTLTKVTEESFVEFKIYISLKLLLLILVSQKVLQNSKFTYLSNPVSVSIPISPCFVEFKIYISLKQIFTRSSTFPCFVEFKIYISLKHACCLASFHSCFVEFKIYISLKQFCFHIEFEISFVEFKIYISLKRAVVISIYSEVLQNSKFTYLSNNKVVDNATTKVLQNSKFTYLSNHLDGLYLAIKFCRIQNLHISQTCILILNLLLGFVEFKIYISLKHAFNPRSFALVLQNSKFTYLSNSHQPFFLSRLFCRIQNLHISQTNTY